MNDKPQFLSPSHFNELPLQPPFTFLGMTTSVLPLRANIAALQHLLDRYGNFVPPQVGRFRASLPYVYLMIVDYGKLALEATNLGWFSQTEILFTFPADHYTRSGDRWVFQGTVWFSPFIFVDSDTSLMLGRRVYGWTKLRQQSPTSPATWLAEPAGARAVATLETSVIDQLYEGRREASRVFCEILQTPDRSTELPPDTGGAWFPWSMAKNAADQWLGAGRDARQTLLGMGGMPARPDVFFASAMNLLEGMKPQNPDHGFTTFNLKQFRDAARPENYCYQALTSATMRVTNFHRAGMLTDFRGLGLDPSGGIRVRLHRWSVLPIADSLGLVATREWQGPGAPIVELAAVNPFWYRVDMLYERGRNLAERTHDGVWDTPHGRYRNPARSQRPAAMKAATKADANDRTQGPDLDLPDALFNTTLGAATHAVAGPFDALDAKLEVFPLLADGRKLQAFLDAYLNQSLAPLGLRFEPWGAVGGPESDSHVEHRRSAYVYLTITKWGPVRSGTNDIGDWKGEELTVYVPVRWYHGDELMGAGLVPVIDYASSTSAMIANAEIHGWPSRAARFVRPPQTWLDDPAEPQRALLEVHAEVLPSLAQGQAIEEKRIISIAHERQLDEAIRQQWASALECEVARKRFTQDALILRKNAPGDLHELAPQNLPDLCDARTLALDFLVQGSSLSIYGIKQFRDIQNPELACYQSLTRVQRSICAIARLERLPEQLVLTFAEYESNPIVELLGLEATLVRTESNQHLYWVKPIHPFWAELGIREELGECLYYRTSRSEPNEGWRPGPQAAKWTSYFAPGHVEGRMLAPRLAARIDRGAPLGKDSLAPHSVHLGSEFGSVWICSGWYYLRSLRLQKEVTLSLSPLPLGYVFDRPHPAFLNYASTIQEGYICFATTQFIAEVSNTCLVVIVPLLLSAQTGPCASITTAGIDAAIDDELGFVELVATFFWDSKVLGAGMDWVVNYCLRFDPDGRDYTDLDPSDVPTAQDVVAYAMTQWPINKDVPMRERVFRTAMQALRSWLKLFVIGLPVPIDRARMQGILADLVQNMYIRPWALAHFDVPTAPPLKALILRPPPPALADDAACIAAWQLDASESGPPMTAAIARRILIDIDPQMILESMLAREWGSRASESPRRTQARSFEALRRESAGALDPEGHEVTELIKRLRALELELLSADFEHTNIVVEILESNLGSFRMLKEWHEQMLELVGGSDHGYGTRLLAPWIEKRLDPVIVDHLARTYVVLAKWLDYPKDDGILFKLVEAIRATWKAEKQRVIDALVALSIREDFTLPSSLAPSEP